MIAAFMNAQQTFMTNQERPISHITQSHKVTKKPPSSSDFPALTDKQTNRDECADWYSKVISLLATEDWLLLYDPVHMDIIQDGTAHPTLNNHLYSVLLNKSKDKPQKLIQALEHLRNNGVALLHELRQAYYG